MPIYEFRCENDHLSEVMQRMSDEPLASCPVCGASVQRVFRPIAVHFKGSGFYNTDYGTKNRSRELKEAGEGTGKYATGDGDGGGGGEKKESKKDGAEAKPKAESGASKGESSKSDSSSSGGGGEKPAKKPAGGE